MLRITLAALVLASARPALAAPASSFEQSLSAIQRQLGAERARRLQDKSAGLADRIERLANDAANLFWEANRLRGVLQDLRARARRYQRPDSDPFFRSDLDRLVWDLRDFAGDADRASRQAEDITRQASKDPALVEPARSLLESAASLRSECAWLESDGRWAAQDFRYIGFHPEAGDVEREARDADESSRRLEGQAKALSAKVDPQEKP